MTTASYWLLTQNSGLILGSFFLFSQAPRLVRKSCWLYCQNTSESEHFSPFPPDYSEAILPLSWMRATASQLGSLVLSWPPLVHPPHRVKEGQPLLPREGRIGPHVRWPPRPLTQPLPLPLPPLTVLPPAGLLSVARISQPRSPLLVFVLAIPSFWKTLPPDIGMIAILLLVRSQLKLSLSTSPLFF